MEVRESTKNFFFFPSKNVFDSEIGFRFDVVEKEADIVFLQSWYIAGPIKYLWQFNIVSIMQFQSPVGNALKHLASRH